MYEHFPYNKEGIAGLNPLFIRSRFGTGKDKEIRVINSARHLVSIPYSSGLGLEPSKVAFTTTRLSSLNPLFIRSRFGTRWRKNFDSGRPRSLNPLFIRSRFGTR